MPRYANLPKGHPDVRHLQVAIGARDWDIETGWWEHVEIESVVDALGRPVEHCVFACSETGTVVIKDPGARPGVFPYRIHNRPAPLTVTLKPKVETPAA